MSDKIREAFEARWNGHLNLDRTQADDRYLNEVVELAFTCFKEGALAQQPSPVAVPSDFALRSRVADLLHLLQFAKIETPSHGDGAQAEVAMNDLERMLAAPAAPVAVGQEPVAWQDPDNLDRICSARSMREAKRAGGATLSALKPLTRPLYAAPPVAEQPYSTTSDKYRAELYDEVWEKARGMGYGNVTEALVALERMKEGEA